MPTLTIRRLDETDHDWLRRAARREGISVEEYVRRMVRAVRTAESRTLRDVLEAMNASLDADERKLLAEPPDVERPRLRARDVAFGADDDEASVREAS